MECLKVHHVLFISFPVLSHMNPMLYFSKRLASKGVKVTIAPPLSITNSDGWDLGRKAVLNKLALDIEAHMERFNEVGLKNISNLIDYPVNCVVYSSLYSHCFYRPVAKRFGLLGAAFYVSVCAANAVHYHVPQTTRFT
ncbi:hypothetical protein FRX31_024533 [Thalictrum thalictroides]|uniref:Uncharacterized protein n=1 Tax=Thalictrum thalictroides TaxID=46969 RepID=A0A7J6VMA6_THATH|nr:hypothetical protein FRX31_024533 [Thalictrum thalictroides]